MESFCTDTHQDVDLTAYERTLNAKAIEWTNDARTCYGSFISVLNGIAEDCDDEVLENLFAAYQDQDNDDAMSKAFAQCIYNSCHRCAVNCLPRPL